ncbi:hypothetical protein M1525_01040 [Patescibacteria group bacterium]|nr:hypothetical protein [Patescibacteria group bacterium]
MDYSKLLKETWRLIFSHHNRFIWAFGIFVALFGIWIIPHLELNQNFNFHSLNYLSPQFSNLISIKDFFATAQKNLTFSITDKTAAAIESNSINLVVSLILLGLTLVIVLIAETSLIVSVIVAKKDDNASADSIENQEIKFKRSLKTSFKFFGRILGLEILMILIAIGLVIDLIFPSYLFFYSNQNLLAIIAFLLLLPFFLFFLIAINILNNYGLRIILNEDEKVIGSVKKANQLIFQNVKTVFIIWLISLGLRIVFIGLALIGLVLLVLPLVGIGLATYSLFGLTGAFIFSLITAIILLLLTILFKGVFISFDSAFWTLSYFELKDKATEKTE